MVDPPSIIATHLTEIIKSHADEILGRQEVQSILDTLKSDYPTVVEEASKALSVGEIQKVLQGLLREQVSIRNMVTILETLADYGGITKDIGFLVEKCRQALGRQICLQHADEKKTLRVLTLAQPLEQKIIDSRVETARGFASGLEPAVQRRWVNAVSNAVRRAQEQGHGAVLLCSEAARPVVKSSTAREIPHLTVLSVPEVVPEVSLESLGEIRSRNDRIRGWNSECSTSRSRLDAPGGAGEDAAAVRRGCPHPHPEEHPPRRGAGPVRPPGDRDHRLHHPVGGQAAAGGGGG